MLRKITIVFGILILTSVIMAINGKQKDIGTIWTVLGPIKSDRMGITLPHEHVLVDFIGSEMVSQDRYDAEDAFQVILPHLQRIKQFDVQTLVECTPSYLGKDPLLLKRLAERTRINIITNTGYYGAHNNKFLPAHAFTETADQLAERWIKDWEDGIEGTGVKPGFIKIGIDAGPLSDLHRKLVQAAARTHLKTGLSIGSHTGSGPILDEIEILEQEGVSPGALIWIHANAEKNLTKHVEIAKLGAWIEFDGLAWESIDVYIKLLSHMRENGLLDHVLISHDAGWYDPAKKDGGEFKEYEILFLKLIPALKNNGFTPGEIDQLIVHNPASAFTIRIRSLHNQEE